MRLYSHSRLWLFENCAEAYKMKYIEKKFPDIPVSASLILGSAVHDTLEELYKKVMKGEIWELDEMIRFYACKWNELFTQDVRITNGDKPNDFLNKGIKFLIGYYTRHFPFKDKTIELEKRIVFPLDESMEIGIQGYVDRIVKIGESEFEVHDYKTNNMIKKQDEIDKDRQLAFYHLGLQNIFGKGIKVKLIWHFLAHDKRVVSYRTQEQLEELKERTLKLIRHIEGNDFWPSCGKKWCDWCSFKEKNGLSVEGNRKIIANGNLGKWMQ